jgi:2-polyprenyl-3-methyl-5-hydroxy-6-metoxy-1,4-benzoquinol methylase
MSNVSFRDPAGFCWVGRQRVIRGVNSADAEAFGQFLSLPSCKQWQAEGRLIPCRRLSSAELISLRGEEGIGSVLAQHPSVAVYEHPRVFFPSYPGEWPPEMLHAAAVLTLDLAQAALRDGYGIKDATPFNILFQGCQPVFVDLLSFETRRPTDPLWLPAAQFERTFLLPLMAFKYFGLPLADIFMGHRDGLEPEAVYRLCSRWRRLLPPILGYVTLPTWLARKKQDASIYRPRSESNPDKARFILEMLLGRFRRALRAVSPPPGEKSVWSDYTEGNSYNSSTLSAKEEFVRTALEVVRARKVLDVGANTGQYSFLAARAGAEVVAVDYDVACVGRIWRQAQEHRLDVLPLVVNLARPTPALGWRNAESMSFLDRARGSFDSVLMLAVLHHLTITERIPMAEVLALAAELTTDLLVIEFVGPADAMFQSLLRGRAHLYEGLTQAAFESACVRHFAIERRLPLAGLDRCLYQLRRKK